MPQRTMSKWLAGSRRVAALLAAWTTILGARRRSSCRERRERVELRGDELEVAVGGREVRHRAG